jgi:hypothetical protein
MPHIVELDRSFVDNISRFVPPAETEMGDIIRELEVDDHFIPNADEYDFDAGSCGYCVCRHKSHWEGWQMYWYAEVGFSHHEIAVRVGLIEWSGPGETLTLRPLKGVSF